MPKPRKLSPLEHELFLKGWASSRIVAYKLNMQQTSVLRKVARGDFKSTRHGYRRYVGIKSVVKWYRERGGADIIQALGLDDWNDVFTTDPQGNLYVRQH